MCGDHLADEMNKVAAGGSPPHVRGPLKDQQQVQDGSGITPACAGTTSQVEFTEYQVRDHPRMCGDHVLFV